LDALKFSESKKISLQSKKFNTKGPLFLSEKPQILHEMTKNLKSILSYK